VTCPEERLVAFLAGELSSEEERRFHEHLLGCEQCWRAVQADRAARPALGQLSQPAPARLQGESSSRAFTTEDNK
jgi:anti-sigma factor RsiW